MFKVTKKEVSLVEMYLISFGVTAFGLYSSGDHNIKKIAWSAAIAVFGPVYVSLKAKAKAVILAKSQIVKFKVSQADAAIIVAALNAARTPPVAPSVEVAPVVNP